MDEKTRTPPYPLRMPDELRAKLEEAAKGWSRSLHAEIISRLIASFETGSLPKHLQDEVATTAAELGVSFADALEKVVYAGVQPDAVRQVLVVRPFAGMAFEEMRALFDVARSQVDPDATVYYQPPDSPHDRRPDSSHKVEGDRSQEQARQYGAGTQESPRALDLGPMFPPERLERMMVQVDAIWKWTRGHSLDFEDLRAQLLGPERAGTLRPLEEGHPEAGSVSGRGAPPSDAQAEPPSAPKRRYTK